MARIRLKYVNSFANPDRQNATVRHYFRKRGMNAIPLPGQPGGEEFMAAYAMALAGLPDAPKPEIGKSRTLPGTVNALAVSYYRCDAWLGLDEETRKTRRRVIEKFRERHGDKRVALLRREHVVKMLAEIEGQSARRSWFKAVRPLLQHAVPTMLREDPTLGIATPKLPKTKGHHPWTEAEIAQYRAHWPCGTQQRLVMEFAFESYSRRGEVVRLGPQHLYTGPDGVDELGVGGSARSTPCPRHTSPSSSPPMASRAPNSAWGQISPNGRGRPVCPTTAVCMDSKRLA